MNFIILLNYFLSILIPGFLLLWLFFRPEKKISWLNLALAYGLGSFFLTAQIFIYLFLFRLNFSLPFFWAIFLGEDLLLFCWCWRKKVLPIEQIKKIGKIISGGRMEMSEPKLSLKFFVVAFLVLIILANSFVLLDNALARPTMTFDSVTMWAAKAKILFYENHVSFDKNSPLYLGGGGHINYPWQIPLQVFWLEANLGHFDDLLSNLIFIAYFFALLLVLFFWLKKFTSGFVALVFTFFLFSMPLFFYHGFNAYADLPLAFYVLLGGGFLYFWLSSGRKRDLFASAIFFGLSFWVKDGAIFYLAPAVFVVAVAALAGWREKKAMWQYPLVMAAPVLPWLLFKIFYHQGINNTGWGFGFHPQIFESFFWAMLMFTSGSWNLWWAVLIIFLLVNIKKMASDRALLLGWVFAISCFLAILAVYLFTERFEFAVDQTSVSRNLLVLVPVMVFLVGLFFKKENKTDVSAL
ncbi:MAG TPA: hypothetical protein VMD74_00010 [Candidatus Methylomirabilis sp.]|nr:hypothetical protein [Candidatus Methylomirabilis sp.]